MKKQLFAAATAVALALGFVAVNAASASAHHPVITGTFECQTDTTGTITWKVANSENHNATVIESTGDLYAGVTLPGSKAPVVKTQAITTTGTYELKVKAKWGNGVIESRTGEVTVTDKMFDKCFVPEPEPEPKKEVGLYIYKKLDINKAAAWENSGLQTFCASKPGADWFQSIACELPVDVCGPGWAFQQDKVKDWAAKWGDKTFNWPTNIQYPVDNIGWPPIYDAYHGELSLLTDVPDCDEPEPGIAEAHLSTTDPTCDANGDVVLGTVTGAEWGEVTWNDGSYTVVATVVGDNLFPAGPGVSDDRTTKTFTGNLKQLSGDACEEPEIATAALTTTDPTCEANGTVVLGDITGATWGEVTWDGGNYTVIATANQGYVFPAGEGVSDDGSTKTFTGSLEKLTGEQCDQLAVVGDPTFVDATCPLPGDVATGSYTVVAAANVTYTIEIDGEAAAPVLPGTYFVTEFPTTVKITAVAADGYTLGDAQSVWEHTFIAPPTVCDLPDLDLVTPEVSFKDMTCTTNGSYTIGGENVAWTVNGVAKAAGTYPVSSSQTVTLVASPVEPHGFAPEQQTEWEHTFTKPVDSTCDDLTTLALTGSDILLVGSGAAFLLLGLGTMLIGFRRQNA